MVAERFERSWTSRALPESVPRLRRAVVDFVSDSGIPDPPLADVRLAVSEALTNVVLHGYRDRDEPDDVTVQVHAIAHEVRITVRDEGVGLSPRNDSPGLGLGLGLISAIADRVAIQSDHGHGTSIEMTFAY